MKNKTATEAAINIEALERIKHMQESEKKKMVRNGKKLVKSLLKQLKELEITNPNYGEYMRIRRLITHPEKEESK